MNNIDIIDRVVELANRFPFKYAYIAIAATLIYTNGLSIELGTPQKLDSVGLSQRLPANSTDGESDRVGAHLTSSTTPTPRSTAAVEAQREAYFRAYAPIAQAEMKEHGIPASITLAQGLLESGVGASRLASATNNHFGIKCFEKSCKPGHCVNFDDDHHKDFFRAYGSPLDSYRDHSRFLVGKKRYAKLFKLAPTDYKGWAHGLRAAGYATDPSYGSKLIRIIERYELDTYDRAN